LNGGTATDEALRDYYAARAGEYDDWYLRRGRYSHGPYADAAWAAELDQATRWLGALSMDGEIVELAAGTGWWSAVLATKGQLTIYDAVQEPLEIAAERLAALGRRARVEVRDAWAEPDRQVDALFCGFWLSHVPRARLGEFLGVCSGWLKPAGVLAFIDSRLDPESSAINHPRPADDLSVRRLNDGREFVIPKVYYQLQELTAALSAAGFESADVVTTARFFLLGTAVTGR
jgi:demethylmenaquinone methyltransferase/2-methoxy-6-polyprenyl-1,4-benzoquinol methylase